MMLRFNVVEVPCDPSRNVIRVMESTMFQGVLVDSSGVTYQRVIPGKWGFRNMNGIYFEVWEKGEFIGLSEVESGENKGSVKHG